MFKVGDTVEWSNGSTWFPGKVVATDAVAWKENKPVVVHVRGLHLDVQSGRRYDSFVYSDHEGLSMDGDLRLRHPISRVFMSVYLDGSTGMKTSLIKKARENQIKGRTKYVLGILEWEDSIEGLKNPIFHKNA